jgi:hypothetical protein
MRKLYYSKFDVPHSFHKGVKSRKIEKDVQAILKEQGHAASHGVMC